MHCNTGQGKTASLLFSAALQTSLTAGLCLCNYTYGNLLLLKVCSDAAPMHCSTGQGKTASQLFSALCKPSLQQPCVTANTALEIWFSYRCAVMQNQSTAALVRAE